jgi:hypothetical protein
MRKIFQNAAADIPAAVVVFLVALPLCLGIALGSGAPLFSGIITGMAGGIVIGLLSGSSLSISGPAAGLTAGCCCDRQDASLRGLSTSAVIAGVIQLYWDFYGQALSGIIFRMLIQECFRARVILILKQFPHLTGITAIFQAMKLSYSSTATIPFELVNSLNHITITVL